MHIRTCNYTVLQIILASLNFETYSVSLFSGLTCKACSLDVLSHEWHRKSTDALNNNLRPKSDCHGTLISPQEYRRYQVPEICSDEEEELEEEGGEEEENITISNESRCLFYHTSRGYAQNILMVCKSQ